MWQILTNLIEFGLFFLDPKYPNATRPENYGYFICILIIDLNWPGSEKNRSEPKISKYLLGLNVYDPKDPDPKGTGPNRTPRPYSRGSFQRGKCDVIHICVYALLIVLVCSLDMYETPCTWVHNQLRFYF